jgi:hypothetical protein
MNYVINWNLLKHPLNWVTVVLMVLIAGIFFHFLAIAVKQQVATS